MAMAPNQAPAFFVAAALLLLAAAAPPAVAQLLSPPQLMNVNGVLTCPVGGGPIPNVTVALSCAIPGVGSGSGALFSAGQSITGPNGQFTISPNVPQLLAATGTTVNGLFSGGLPCLLGTPLPINRTVCAALSTINGTLVGVVSPITNILPGNILNVTGSLNIPIPNTSG